MKSTFFCTKLGKKELRLKIKEFAKSQQVNRVICSKKATFIKGSYSPHTNTIFLCSALTKKTMLCTFFHELSHHIASKQEEWLNYHFDLELYSTDKIFLLENKIDKIAKQLWNEHVNILTWGKYQYSYPVRDKQVLLSWIKQHMKTKNANIQQ